MITRDAALGFRLAVLSGYTARIRALLLGLMVAIVTFIGLGVAASPGVMSAQEERSASRLPVITQRTDDSHLLVDSGWDEDASLGRWNGHDISGLYVHGHPDAPAPPGIDSLPRPGTMYVSPELRKLIASDPVVAALFEQYRIVGTVADDGLIRPAEPMAVVGVPRTADALQPARGFGVADSTVHDDSTTQRLNVVVTGIVVMLIVIPSSALVVIGARMSSAERAGRAVALHLLGLSWPRVRLVLAFETMLIALPSAGLGLAAFQVVRRHLTSIPGTDFDFFASDVAVAPLWQALATLSVVVSTTLVAASASRPNSSSVRTASVSARTRRAPLVLALVGLALVLGTSFVPGLADPIPAVGLYVGVLALAIGIPLSGQIIVKTVARYCAELTRSVASTLGFRISANAPGSAVRIASALAAVIVMLGFVGPFLTVLNGSNAARADELTTAHRAIPVTVFQPGERLESVDFTAWEGVADVERLQDKRGHTRLLRLTVRGDYAKETQARIAGLDTSADPRFGGDLEWVDPDDAQYTAQTMIIAVGAAVCLLLAMLALTMAALGDARSRRARVRGMKLIGGSTLDTARAHLTSTALPIALLGIVAAGAATLTWRAMLHLDDRTVASWWFYLGLAAGSVAVGVVISVVTAPTMTSTLKPDELSTKA
ncbi:hypothetical protein MU582_19025 [Nocardioidaceae bacterium SCSIO 66511]|nr:hypothetical protein MU582_19025 [Nocardioidaceae bacterium SCSIO 66511]